MLPDHLSSIAGISFRSIFDDRSLILSLGIRSDSPVVNKAEVNNINRKFLIKFRSKFTYFYTFEPIS